MNRSSALAIVGAAAVILASAPDATAHAAAPGVSSRTVVHVATVPARAGHTWRPCPTEDSRSCVWDAVHNGNGHGRSYWTGSAGRVHYVTHARAHAMLHHTTRKV